MTIHSIVIQKLLSTNAQLGRRVAAHHFKVYTYGFRNKMAIIDSDKTLICMRSACNFLGSLARQKGRFMFINTNPLFDEIFEEMTKRIGSYSPRVNALWRTGGFLTNSGSPKKFRSRNKKITFGPTQPPDCIVIIDTERKSSVINEADKLQIPIVALVDSNMPLDCYKRIAYPVPANDSVQFVYLFCNLITKTLMLEKKKMEGAKDRLSATTGPEVEAREVKRIAEDKNKVDLPQEKVTVFPYASLASISEDVEKNKNILDKLVVLKFNGCSKTNVDLDGPKSAIEICDGLTFLDLLVKQIETLNTKYASNVPLLLLNTVDTHDNTLKVLEKHSQSSVDVHAFRQGQDAERNILDGNNNRQEVCPFESGAMFLQLISGGTLDLLLSQGKEYILVINSDNVTTVIDPNILNHLMENNIEYCMEVIPSFSSYLNTSPMDFKLLEIARSPDKQVDVVKLRDNFKLIDTGNMWVNLRSLRRLVDTDRLKFKNLSVSKEKENDQNHHIETAAGSAIQFFDHAIGVYLPESRYIPFNSTSDLLLLQSDLYTCREGVITRNPARSNPSNPMIDLGPEFEKVGDFQSRFRSIPSIIDLQSLTVRGDVRFGANITLKGRVTITAKPGTKLEIPDGVVIDNKEINSPSDI